MAIIQYFLSNLRKNPNHTALILNDRDYSYSKISEFTETLCAKFISEGIKCGSHVAVVLDNSLEFVVTLLAIADIGAVCVPINPELSLDQIQKVIAESDSEYLVSNSVCSGKYTDSQIEAIFERKKFIFFDKDFEIYINDIKQLSTDYRKYILGKNHNQEELEYILTATSGSTGEPKMIVLTQGNKIKRMIQGCRDLYNLDMDDVIITASPMYHSLGLRLSLLPLIIGCTSVILKKFVAKQWLETIEKYRVTFTIAVSVHLTQAYNLIRERKYNLDSLRVIVSSSSPINFDIRESLVDLLQCKLYECYGASEVGIATNILINHDCPKSSVGKALEYVDLRIIDSDRNEVDPGTIGQIICKSATCFKGYYKSPSLTKQSILSNYFYTGDLGFIDGDGYLYLVGRLKDVIIVGGANVYAIDIEKVINNFDSVEECAVVGIKDSYFGEVPAVAIVPRGKGFNLLDIKVRCSKELASYQQPRAFNIVDKLPKNAMGKTMKHILKKDFSDYDSSSPLLYALLSK